MKNNGVRLMSNYFKAMFDRGEMSYVLHCVSKPYRNSIYTAKP